jgi:hypothetical protein
MHTDLIKRISEIEDPELLVSILVLTSQMVDVNTISGMARSEGKTPRGIRISNQYRKIKIGDCSLAVKGLKESGLPF